MGKLVLHGVEASPPVRSVLFTLKALEQPFELKVVNILGGEHLTPEYLAKNPHGTVPTLEDNGVYLTDSHAIVTYLVRKYGKDDSLYPKDFNKRAVVDERLFYDASTVFYGALRTINFEMFRNKVTEVPQAKINNIQKVYETIEDFLKQHNYVAGDQLTIADFTLVSTITSMTVFLEIDAVKYPKVTAWINRLEQLPYFKEANAGVETLHATLKSMNFTIVP